jgi:hypothetical protein
MTCLASACALASAGGAKDDSCRLWASRSRTQCKRLGAAFGRDAHAFRLGLRSTVLKQSSLPVCCRTRGRS